jgi:hypothetical protein
MQATTELTSTQWQIAEIIAYELAQEQSEINHRSRSKSNSDGILTETKKVIAYLRDLNTNASLFQYLEAWVKHGNDAGHGNDLVNYYKAIDAICREYLLHYQEDQETSLRVLGWAARLYRYYKANPKAQPIALNVGFASEAQKIREEKNNQLVKSGNLEVGKQLDAIVLEKKKKGSEVTYEISGISFKEKEKKEFDAIPDNGAVIVEVKSLKENGHINHVKFVSKAN